MPPVFINEPYQASLNQNSLSGTSVSQVIARDNDTTAPFNTVTYSIIGDDSPPAYFNINPITGQISLQQSIATDPTNRYLIRVLAQDGGNPRLSDTTVDVERNLVAPVLRSTEYAAQILETQEKVFERLHPML